MLKIYLVIDNSVLSGYCGLVAVASVRCVTSLGFAREGCETLP